MTAPENYRQLSAALRWLADRCDGAVDEDGQGFNGLDARFGHTLADTDPLRWSPKMAIIAHRMATTYRVQLMRGAGINVSTIEAPSAKVDVRKGRSGSQKRCTSFTATIVGEEVHLTSPAWPGGAAIGAVKTITGRRFTKKPKVMWAVPLSQAAELIRLQMAKHVTFNEEIGRKLHKVIATQAAATTASRGTDAEITVEGLGTDELALFPFQRAGVAYTKLHPKTFIADDMGLGKTPMAIASLKMHDAFPALIVCPASLKFNWDAEIRKWLPRIRNVAMLGSRKPVPISSNTAIAIINYDVLPSWKKTIEDWRVAGRGLQGIVFDESHYLKNRATKRTRAALALVKKADPHVRLNLSGTPIDNAPQELMTQLQLLDRLRDFGGVKGFTDRYVVRGDFGLTRQGKNLGELNAKMRSLCYVRRLKADVLDELPAKRRVRVPIEMKSRAGYERALAKVAKRMVAARMERKAAKAEGRDAEGWAVAAAVVGIGELRRAIAESKFDACMKWTRDMMESGEKLVIFGHHKDLVVKRIQAELECPAIYGDMNAEQKHAAVQQFQNDPNTRAIVLNLKAGGVGHTLTASSNVVFFESGWTPGSNDQCEDRCHRIGQHDSVTAWYLEAVQTIDGWMSDLIAKKRLVVDAATEGDEESQQSIMSELADMIEGRKAA